MLLLAGAVLAGDIYINGVRADVPPVVTMESVSVRFDEQGNVWIDAPQYRVTVVPAAQAAAGATPAVTASPPPQPTPFSVAAPAAGAVPAATWWLATEDNGSDGQNVELLLNGVSVCHVRSGEPQMIIDVGAWLKRGANEVRLRASPGRYGGGALVVYLGRGRAGDGTVNLDTPDVRYTRRAIDLGGGGDTVFTVQVP